MPYEDVRDKPVSVDAGGIRWTITYVKGVGKAHIGADQVEVVGMHPAMQGEVFRQKFPYDINSLQSPSHQADWLCALVYRAARSIGLKVDA